MPAKELVDGGLILFAGALMLTPGFVTDALGVVLLLAPTRMVVRSVLMRRFRHRVQFMGRGPGATVFGFGGDFVDVEAHEREVVDLERDDPPPTDPGSLGS